MRWPSTFQLPEIQQSFREVWETLTPWLTGNPDLNGRRFTNAGEAVANQEFITLGQGDRRYEPKGEEAAVPTTRRFQAVRIDTFANRGSARIWANTFFEASDWNYVGWASNGTNWIYAYGLYSRTQSQLAAAAGNLGTNDAGLLANVTDFTHVLRWTGTVWEYGPGELGSFFFQDFPGTPPGGTWGLCDGSTYSYLKADGTTANFVSKNLTGHYRKSVTSGADATAAAIAPGISGSTGSTTATNQAATATNQAAATGITLDSHTSTNTTTVAGADAKLTGPTSHIVTDPTHNHTQNSHNHTQDAHLHGVGTLAVDSTGEPAVYKVLTYFRR